MSDELERSIAAYRRELDESLGGDDAAELEDHLRELIAQLRAAGRSAEIAFAEAVRRVGEPRALGREFARVTPVFGTVLSRARAWSAAALLAPMVIAGLVASIRGDQGASLLTTMGATVVLAIGFVVALIARRTWARAILLGASAINIVGTAVPLLIYPEHYLQDLPFLLGHLGATAFLLPWKRGELSAVGWGLAGLGFAFSGVVSAATISEGMLPDAGNPAVSLLLIGTFMAGSAGVLLRARWASPVLVVTALAMVPALDDLRRAGEIGGNLFFPTWLAMTAAGAIALVAAAVASWPTARSGLGTLRALVR